MRIFWGPQGYRTGHSKNAQRSAPVPPAPLAEAPVHLPEAVVEKPVVEFVEPAPSSFTFGSGEKPVVEPHLEPAAPPSSPFPGDPPGQTYEPAQPSSLFVPPPPTPTPSVSDVFGRPTEK